MLRRHRQIRTQIHQLLDACLFAVSFYLAYELRTEPRIAEWLHLELVDTPFDTYVWLYLILIPAVPVILESQGFYARPLLCSRRTTAWRLFRGCVVISLGVVLGLFLLRLYMARGVVVWFGLMSFGMVMLKEELVSLGMRSRVAKEQLRRRFILVGPPEETQRMRAELKRHAEQEVVVVAELNPNERPITQLVEMLHEYSVNGVILSGQSANFQHVEAAVHACELEGVEVWLVADFFRTQISRTSFDDFYGRPVLVFRSAPEASWQGLLKQLLDFVLAFVLLATLMPFLLVCALLIRLTSPGPVLFRQQRSGLNGRPFTLYKFRTMVSNAEQLKHELQAMNEMTGPVFKLTKDPRITKVGSVFRKFSIDELPQLYNVLRGEMSLVGPRPLPVDEVRRFNDLAHRRRLSVKPGLTCLWQISGRSEVKDFRDWVRLDLEYIDNWSLWLDMKILWRTVPIVITGAGAK